MNSFFLRLDTARRVLITIVFWIVMLVILVFFVSVMVRSFIPDIKYGSVLEINANGYLVNGISTPVGSLLGNSEILLDVFLSTIMAAKNDNRIDGILLRLDGLTKALPASSGELADALEQFKASGKPIISYSDSYATSSYRIASVADYIFVERLGMVLPRGYGSYMLYFGGGMEKFGGKMDVFRSGESKSYPDRFTSKGMSDQARRNAKNYYDDLWDIWLKAVSRNRQIKYEVLKEWIDNYDIHLKAVNGDAAQAAMDASLIDGIETGGVVDAKLVDLFGKDFHLISAIQYNKHYETLRHRRNVIAVVPIVGEISEDSLFWESGISTYIVEKMLKQVEENPRIRALVLRIDSPGGSATESEYIRRHIERLKDDLGIPVVVSMGDVAASGAYWIATASDVIFARPETITGSIGVFTMRPNFQQGLAEHLGLYVDGYSTTPWIGYDDPGLLLNDKAASVIQSSVLFFDDMFKKLVAESRGTAVKDIDAVSGGIPWTGRQALKIGLVDFEGGLLEAIAYAAEQAGLSKWEVKRFSPSDLELFSYILDLVNVK